MKWFRRIAYFLLAVFLVAGILVGVLQSRWGQEKIRALITSSLERGGVQVEIGQIHGQLPHRLTLGQVEARLPDGSSLSVESITAEFSIFYLLKNEISFKKVDASHVVWTRGPGGTGGTAKGRSIPSLPISLSVKSLNATDVFVDEKGPFQIQGRIEIASKSHHLFLDLKASQADDKARFMALVKRNGTSQWTADAQIADLTSWVSSPYQGSVQVKIYGQGDEEKTIRGRIEGTATPKMGPARFQNEWSFNARFRHASGGGWAISRGSVNSDILQARGSANFDAKGTLLDASGQIQSDKLFPDPFQGRILARLLLRNDEGKLIEKAVGQIPLLKIGGLEWKDVDFTLDGIDKKGTFTLKGDRWKSDGNFSWENLVSLSNIRIDSPEMRGTGSLSLLPEGQMEGSADLAIDNLQILKPFAPELNPFGRVEIKADWKNSNLNLNATANELYVRSFYFEKANLTAALQDPFKSVSGSVVAEASGGLWHGLRLDATRFETQISGAEWPFSLTGRGVWNRNFETSLNGVWHLDSKEFAGTVQNWNGSFYNQPFSLTAPVEFYRSKNKTEITNTELVLAASNLTGRFRHANDSGELYLRLEQFPLDFLSLNPLEVSITGQLDFEGKITEAQKKVSGDFKAALSYVEISELGEIQPINAEGILTGRLEQDQFLLQGALSAHDEPLASIDMKLPIRVEMEPWRAELLYSRPNTGHFSLNGRIEDVLDFMNLGSHWLEGNCNCDLKWSNTLKNPLVEGYCRLEDGYYENYYTGTQLTDLNVEFLAEKDRLFLHSLKAKDGAGKGALLGDGVLYLRLDEKLPFQFHLAFQEFNFVQIGFIDAEANGAIDLKGTYESATAKGQIHVIDSKISIPENLTRSLPNLQVVYKNAQKPPEVLHQTPRKSYPFLLDLEVDAPKGVTISGRGLRSEWKGDFHLGGSLTSPQPKGTLELIQGEFSFSGRAFKLNRGSLTFSGQSKEMPHLDLTGSTEQQGISILANLSGPLNSPQLTFQSVPPLPLSAIIAHLLFGQDISEINGLQALQLATSVAKIAGETPDVLETTRRSLGIDRLRIVSTPDDEGGESISIQVGKYVAKGVIVSITQGTEYSAPNISIEVDIGAGFFFIGETDQVHEQGKFAFKWNRNY
ncbi:MAG: translocation/assembly module TamB domain-containing protein [Verrucomicrobia bacterium]|nr:translocation/assembly module TamB domain-containing protein [Verrucomicrobiota bacterium]